MERGDFSLIFAPVCYDTLSTKLGLSNIDIADSFSIRLWTQSMFGCNLMTVINNTTHSYSYKSVATLNENRIKSKISTQEFLQNLQSFDFEKMISQYEIKGFKDDVDDGTQYTLEIMTGRHYKVLQYHSPDAFNDPDNKAFSKIIDLCYKYFHSEN